MSSRFIFLISAVPGTRPDGLELVTKLADGVRYRLETETPILKFSGRVKEKVKCVQGIEFSTTSGSPDVVITVTSDEARVAQQAGVNAINALGEKIILEVNAVIAGLLS